MLAEMLKTHKENGKLRKPSVAINIDALSEESHDMEKDEAKHLQEEITALKNELASFDPKQAAEDMKASLMAELNLKKAKLAVCKAKLGEDYEDEGGDNEADGEMVAEGNPGGGDEAVSAPRRNRNSQVVNKHLGDRKR